jgi:hypothetical protein
MEVPILGAAKREKLQIGCLSTENLREEGKALEQRVSRADDAYS